MKATKEIIKEVFNRYNTMLAFSGGGDSMVLLDIVYNIDICCNSHFVIAVQPNE